MQYFEKEQKLLFKQNEIGKQIIKEKQMSKEKSAEPTADKDNSRAARLARLEDYKAKIIKKYDSDAGLITVGNLSKQQMTVEAVSTGSLMLDDALGVGGFARGRITEIMGPEASGKTTLTLCAIAQAQSQGNICAFIDAEQALDVVYAKKLGVKFEHLVYVSPDSGEQALQIAKDLAESGDIDMIIIDSVAALTPQKEIDGEIGDATMGAQARMMGQGLRTLVAPVKKNNVVMIFINQLRMKIGVMFGSPETTTGGEALKFYASLRLRVSKLGSAADKLEVNLPNDKGEVVAVEGYNMNVIFKKNKFNPTQEALKIPILANRGIYKPFDLFLHALETGVITKSGNSYAFEEKVFSTKSKDAAVLAFVQDADLQKRVEKKVRENITKKRNAV